MTNEASRLALAELEILIDEFNPLKSDWNFRKGVIKQQLEILGASAVGATREEIAAAIYDVRRFQHKDRVSFSELYPSAQRNYLDEAEAVYNLIYQKGS